MKVEIKMSVASRVEMESYSGRPDINGLSASGGF